MRFAVPSTVAYTSSATPPRFALPGGGGGIRTRIVLSHIACEVNRVGAIGAGLPIRTGLLVSKTWGSLAGARGPAGLGQLNRLVGTIPSVRQNNERNDCQRPRAGGGPWIRTKLLVRKAWGSIAGASGNSETLSRRIYRSVGRHAQCPPKLETFEVKRLVCRRVQSGPGCELSSLSALLDERSPLFYTKRRPRASTLEHASTLPTSWRQL